MSTEISPNDELERHYVDLILQKTGHFATFTPTIQVQIGDYGNIESTTGRFVPCGNLFTESPEFAALTGQLEEIVGEDYCIEAAGREGAMKTFNKEFLRSLMPTAKKAFTAGWNFDEGRHAALVLIDPMRVRMRREDIITKFIAKVPQRQKEYESFVICTEVHKCTSYAFLVTDGEPGNAILAFSPDTVPDHVDPISPMNLIEDHPWTVGITRGFFSTGRYKQGSRQYFPLLTLRKMRMHTGRNHLENASLPT